MQGQNRLRIVLLGFIVASFFATGLYLGGAGGCGGGGGDEAEPTLTFTLTAPELTAILTALGLNNPDGMVPGLALGGITLPECTEGGGDFDVTYSISDLPSWLSFDASTRALSLASGSTVPTDADTASQVTYTCANAADSSVTASQSFTVNDLDAGGVVDGKEYEFGEVPLVNNRIGSIALNPGNVDLYRTPAASARKLPTTIVIVSEGMNPSSAADDTSDFDGDGTSNADEIANGTNPFVAASTGTFAAKVDYATGDEPFDMTAADLDGDGNLDLAAANRNVDTLSVLLGNGDGTFAAKVDYATGDGPDSPTAGDLDGDGDSDLTSLNFGADTLSVFLGNGDGTFAAKVDYATGDGPAGVTAADLDGDGDLDLAATNQGVDPLSVLLGNGDGTFAAKVDYATGDGPAGVTAADLDGDGDLDLAVAHGGANDAISVLLGNGDGTFAALVDYATGNGLVGVTATDLDGDGDLDLATPNFSDDTLSVLLGNGDGTFAAKVDYATEDGPGGVIAADLDGDGDIDLTVANNANGAGTTLSVFLGNGDGTFAARVNYITGNGPRGIVAGDFDGDGDLDLSCSNGDDDTLSVLLNQ